MNFHGAKEKAASIDPVTGKATRTDWRFRYVPLTATPKIIATDWIL